MKYFFSLILFSFLLQTPGAQPANQSEPAFIRDSLDAYIQKGLKDWNVPGLAVVIVKNGNVVWMKGYGPQPGGNYEKDALSETAIPFPTGTRLLQ